ncbi:MULTISPECIES: dTDP-4-dehydrorhamnose 3,5-epimerase family protein [Actinoplanes]|uniref:dTDP-4-dehydrorhamnose 3,5-epimerase family protein n=1 Tax=Actinoplanes TaxID=1865 RepID=UPI0005F2ED58|nr:MULTISPECIES: dTDP-4-dehydrorhamnose 3,5-epimerase family protein [Actinoplanes]GLY02214.1 dTDP-4-dehydrorhamnose 3,5-epimerase [Actinoplanes sp. NBRC 101535]
MTATVEPTAIDGAFLFTPAVYADTRGLFTSPYQDPAFAEALDRPLFPVRDVSHNRSARGVLRGIHYTATPPGRAKYVYCPYGEVLDFLVDLRVGSPTFGRWSATELTGDNSRALYIPVGVGHAFLSLRDDSVVVYLMSEGYVPANELAVSPLDPAIGLPVPDGIEIRQSERDAVAPTLAQARDRGLLNDYTLCRNVEAKLWR